MALPIVNHRMRAGYDGAMAATTDRDFLLSLFEYIRGYTSDDAREPLLKLLLEQEDAERREVEVLYDAALHELNLCLKQTKEAVARHGITEQEVLTDLREIGRLLARRDPELRFPQLRLLSVWRELKQMDLVDPEWEFSDFRAWWQKRDATRRTMESRPWFAMREMITLYQQFEEHEGIMKSYVEDQTPDMVQAVASLWVFEDLKAILNQGTAPPGSTIQIAALRRYLQCVHALTLDFAEQAKERPRSFPRADYDPVTRTLTVGNIQIKFRANSKVESLRTEVLKQIFASPESRRRSHSWDELFEAIDDPRGAVAPNAQNRIFEAGRGINERVREKTDVKNLLKVDQLTIQLDPNYDG